MPQVARLLQKTVDVGLPLLEARYGALGVLRELGDAFACFYTAGVSLEARLAIGPLPLGIGLMGVPMRDPRPLRVRDISQHPHAAGFPEHHPPMRSFLGVPLLSGRRARGGLYFTEKQGAPEFRVQDERLAQTLALLAANVLDDAATHPGVRRSLDYLQSAMEEVDGAGVIMGLNREIIRWSEGARALFGFSAEEVLGRNFVDLLVPPEDRARWRRQFEPRLRRDLEEGKVLRLQATRLHRDGRRIPVAVALHPILHQMAGIKGILGVYKFRKI